MGVIGLDAPLGAASQSDQYQTFAVPLLDDNAVFKWHEKNPGLADYYELRVYAKDGKTLLATQTDHRQEGRWRWVRRADSSTLCQRISDPTRRF